MRNSAMEFREEVTFQLEGLCPARLCALPAQGCLVAVSDAGEMRSLDLVSGTQLNITSEPFSLEIVTVLSSAFPRAY